MPLAETQLSPLFAILWAVRAPSLARPPYSAGSAEPASIGLEEGIGNDRFGAVFTQEIIQRLDAERLQSCIAVEGQLAQGFEASTVHPDQQAEGVDHVGGRYTGMARENRDGTISIAIDFDVKPGMSLCRAPPRKRFPTVAISNTKCQPGSEMDDRLKFQRPPAP